MIATILLAAFFLIAPAIVLVLCRKVTWIGKLGPVLVLYILGVIVGNIGNIFGCPLSESTVGMQKLLSTVTVPFAIPLMLLGSSFSKGDGRRYAMALATGLGAVIIAIVAGFFIFRNQIESGAMGADGAAKIGGLLTGSYTGGTINMAALKTMLGVSDSSYILLNSYDMLVGFVYLIFLMTIGIKLFRMFLDRKSKVVLDNMVDKVTKVGKTVADHVMQMVPEKYQETFKKKGAANENNPYRGLGTKKGLCILGILILVSLSICGISFLITKLFPKVPTMTLFILCLTTLGIGASFIPKLRSLPYSYDVGMYAIYVFSIVVASMADVRSLELSNGAGALGYLLFVVFISLGLQSLLSKLFHLDADTTVISSVALLCSPPFVPMISGAMHNRRALTAGLAIGIIGYAVGTYLGFGIFRLLSLF